MAVIATYLLWQISCPLSHGGHCNIFTVTNIIPLFPWQSWQHIYCDKYHAPFLMMVMATYLLWQISCPFSHDGHGNPFALTNIMSLFPWQSWQPIYCDTYHVPFLMTVMATHLLWQISCLLFPWQSWQPIHCDKYHVSFLMTVLVIYFLWYISFPIYCDKYHDPFVFLTWQSWWPIYNYSKWNKLEGHQFNINRIPIPIPTCQHLHSSQFIGPQPPPQSQHASSYTVHNQWE